VSRFSFGGVTIGGSVRLPMSFQNGGLIPAELRVDLSKHPQFTLMNALPSDGDAGAAAAATAAAVAAAASPSKAADGGAAASGGSDECALIPEDASTASADDDPFSFDSMVAAMRDDKDADSGADMKLFVPHKFTLRIPAGRTLSLDIVFQPTTARHHDFTLPIMLPGLSLPTSLIRTVSADGLEPRLTASCGPVVDFDFRVVQRDPSRRVPYRLKFQLTNVDKKDLQWAIDQKAMDNEAVDADGPVANIFSWSPASGTLGVSVRDFCPVSGLSRVIGCILVSCLVSLSHAAAVVDRVLYAVATCRGVLKSRSASCHKMLGTTELRFRCSWTVCPSPPPSRTSRSRSWAVACTRRCVGPVDLYDVHTVFCLPTSWLQSVDSETLLPFGSLS
jgi:hypothetical protein